VTEDGRKPRFVVGIRPYGELLHLLKTGEVAAMTPGEFAAMIAAELRVQGPSRMPDEVAVWLADHLEGKRRRGRPAEARSSEITRYYSLIYHACASCLRGEGDFPEEFIRFVEEQNAQLHRTMAVHERAAALTSIWCHRHDGHAKKIMNRISARKT
jgi:hypothetical protein